MRQRACAVRDDVCVKCVLVFIKHVLSVDIAPARVQQATPLQLQSRRSARYAFFALLLTPCSKLSRKLNITGVITSAIFPLGPNPLRNAGQNWCALPTASVDAASALAPAKNPLSSPAETAPDLACAGGGKREW